MAKRSPEDTMRGFLSGEDPVLRPHAPRLAAPAQRAPLQALRGALRGSRRCRPAAPRVRPLPRQPRHLRQLHQGTQQDRGLWRRDPGQPPVRRHPRVDGHRRAARARPSSAPSSTTSTASRRRRSSGTTVSSTSSSATRPSASSSSGSAGQDTAAAIGAGRALLDAVGRADATESGPHPRRCGRAHRRGVRRLDRGGRSGE